MRLQLHKLSIIINSSSFHQPINKSFIDRIRYYFFRIIKGGAVATQQMDVGNRIKQVIVEN